ncbi:hypothetical protein [Nostoc sp.]|uniref:hypothetical protein n=1 Tax=Nostoc sp. TaxID=1180 RepID=UPI002FFC297D
MGRAFTNSEFSILYSDSWFITEFKTISVPDVRSDGEVWTIVKQFWICDRDRAASRKEGGWLKKLTLTKN